MRSLFIASLPRSLSSLVHLLCANALDLRSPPWTSSGEVLNGERLVLGAGASPSGRFLRRESEPERFAAMHAYLDTVVQPQGYVYKDVVQPFCIAEWLSRRTDLTVLRIRRRLDDVAAAMLARQWTYPASTDTQSGSLEDRIMVGLIAAERALDSISALEIDYEDLISDPNALWGALAKLYPGTPIQCFPYIDTAFRHKRDEVLARRKTDSQQALTTRLSELRQHCVSSVTPPPTTRTPDAPPVVLLVGNGGITGFGRVIDQLGKGLTASFEVRQLATNMFGSPPPKPWPVSACASRSGVAELTEILNTDPPDIVLFVSDLWFLNDQLAPFNKRDKGPLLIGYAPVEAGPIASTLISNIHRLDHLVLYTHHAKQIVEHALPVSDRPPQISVLPHGVDTTTFHALSDDPVERARYARTGIFPNTPEFEDGFFILNANRNQPRKCIDLTLAGFAAFAKDKPENVKLVLHMGRSDLGWDLPELTRRYALGRRVVLTSRQAQGEPISDHNLNLLFNSCQVGLNTAYAEGWGLVAFEHAATGAAQVMPKLGNLAEIWQDNAEFIEPKTQFTTPQTLYEAQIVAPEAIADALQRLYDEPGYLHERAQEAWHHAQDPAFSWEKIGMQWCVLLYNTLDVDSDKRITAQST